MAHNYNFNYGEFRDNLEAALLNYVQEKVPGKNTQYYTDVSTNILRLLFRICRDRNYLEKRKVAGEASYSLNSDNYDELRQDLTGFINFFRKHQKQMHINDQILDISKFITQYFDLREAKQQDRMLFLIYDTPPGSAIKNGQCTFINEAIFDKSLDPRLVGKINLYCLIKTHNLYTISDDFSFFINPKTQRIDALEGFDENLERNIHNLIQGANANYGLLNSPDLNWCGFIFPLTGLGKAILVNLKPILEKNPIFLNDTDKIVSVLIPNERDHSVFETNNITDHVVDTFASLYHLVRNSVTKSSMDTIILTNIDSLTSRLLPKHLFRTVQGFSALNSISGISGTLNKSDNATFRRFRRDTNRIHRRVSNTCESQQWNGSMISLGATFENISDTNINPIQNWVRITKNSISNLHKSIAGRLIVFGNNNILKNRSEWDNFSVLFDNEMDINNLGSKNQITWYKYFIMSEAVQTPYCILLLTLNHKEFFKAMKSKLWRYPDWNDRLNDLKILARNAGGCNNFSFAIQDLEKK
ncbi:MAG: hypothetical protein GF308_11245 [Candidatus Heimdallarchaeota archaeon]|nr:hypothetical protein [Candidatus Heimdallarchaeota archaeon]